MHAGGEANEIEEKKCGLGCAGYDLLRRGIDRRLGLVDGLLAGENQIGNLDIHVKHSFE